MTLIEQYIQSLKYSNMTPAQLRAAFGDYDDFTYELDFQNLTDNTPYTSTITTQLDSDFVWSQSVMQAILPAGDDTTNSQVLPNITVLIEDETAGRNLSNEPIYLSNLFGSASFPYYLPIPRVFKRNTKIKVSLQVVGPVIAQWPSPNILKLAFVGKKFFRA